MAGKGRRWIISTKYMNRFIKIFFLVLSAISFFDAPLAMAQSIAPSEEAMARDFFYRGQVTRILEEKIIEEFGGSQVWQRAKVRITTGEETGKEVEVNYQVRVEQNKQQKLKEGRKIVVVKSITPEETIYYASEIYRLPAIYAIILLFFFLVVLFAGKRGFMAFIGLAVTIFIITLFIIPKIGDGANPFLVSFLGTILIASTSLFLAHGFKKRTGIAFVSILITIGIALLLSYIFVTLAHLYGLGSEEAFYLQSAPIGSINLRGLLLGGMIIGVLGVLDDVATAQAAAVHELHLANPLFGFKELYRRANSVGQEHITSLVNTLVLAYTGASFPLLLLFTIYDTPFWVTANSEIIVEEIVRTLVGSISLIFAVPITTTLAAYFFGKRKLT